MSNPFRTIVISEFSNLRCQSGRLIVASEDGNETEVPIDQLQDLVLEMRQGSVSMNAMRELLNHHVNVLIMDEAFHPMGTLCGVTSNAGCIMDQAGWNGYIKARVWQEIVARKIETQIALLKHLKLKVPAAMPLYMLEVEPDDCTNREGLAARAYFAALFGPDFRRHAPDDNNAALNYGYAILLNMFSRITALHGYAAALGIHHCSRQNPWNLPCDLVEPFRPIVDHLVYENDGRALDREYKKALISLMQAECTYADRDMKLTAAMDAFTLDVLKKMKDPERPLGRVVLEE